MAELLVDSDCVIDGVELPDWLVVAVGLCVPLGVEPAEGDCVEVAVMLAACVQLWLGVPLGVPLGVKVADAELVEVPEGATGVVMTTRRRRLLHSSTWGHCASAIICYRKFHLSSRMHTGPR